MSCPESWRLRRRRTSSRSGEVIIVRSGWSNVRRGRRCGWTERSRCVSFLLRFPQWALPWQPALTETCASYDTRTGKLRRKCTGFATRVLSVAFSHDGSRVIGGSLSASCACGTLKIRRMIWSFDLSCRASLWALPWRTRSRSHPISDPLAFVLKFSKTPTASIWRCPLQAKGLQELLLHSDGRVKVRFATKARIFAMFRNERARSVELWRY